MTEKLGPVQLLAIGFPPECEVRGQKKQILGI
jgi:hypothetical protein